MVLLMDEFGTCVHKSCLSIDAIARLFVFVGIVGRTFSTVNCDSAITTILHFKVDLPNSGAF